MANKSYDFLTPCSLPETQLVETQTQHLFEEEKEQECWGRLYPTDTRNLSRIDLSKEEYVVGRSPDCDICITESNAPKNLVVVISKLQFKVWRKPLDTGSYLVYLKDMSMNGTFVNKVKVGKSNEIALCNGDEISLARPSFKAYVFVDTAQNQNWLPNELKDRYLVGVHVGSGAYGEVKVIIDKLTQKHFAMKKLLKRDMTNKRIMNEIKALQSINHPCVIQLDNVFDIKDSVYLALEYVDGGELSNKIASVQKMSEEDVKVIFYQLALTVQYMHRKDIVHRDLKPNNILISSRTVKGQALIKIADFGLSKIKTSASDLRSIVGTPLYVAPEILLTNGHGNYDHKVDIWSLGVILYQCLSGVPPFGSKRGFMTLEEQIIRGIYSMRNSSWIGVSLNAKNLVNRMLQVNIDKRISTDEILEHPWLKDDDVIKCVHELMKNSSDIEDEMSENMPPLKKSRYV
uniref:non-specific serine/threonine protein kinase n=1 Tax=Clastoptera arizonana TaxID=38151 RepID=A0A1B6DMK8_9HEMI